MILSRREALAAAALASAAPASAAPRVLELRRGVNLWPWFSLTREHPAPRTDFGWPPFQIGRPTPTPDDLRRLRAAGLDFVRLPVDPGPFFGIAGRERATLTGELRAAIDSILAAGLKAVINIHANGGTHHWTPDRFYGGPAAPGLPGYRAFVAEVAGLLAKIDVQRLAFEPVNEPPQDCADRGWSAIQRDLLTAARVAAPDLTLVATGGCGSMIMGLEALDAAGLARLEPLLFTFHFYEPYLFSHQGAPWMTEPVYRALNGVPWPASAGSYARTIAAVRARMSADGETPEAKKRAAFAETERVLKVYFDADPARPYIDGYLARAKAWADRAGIAPSRILLGEFGALRSDDRYVAAGAADRARYVRDVRQSAEAFGFPWAFWNLFDGMGMMDDATKRFDPAMIEALGLAMPR